MASKVGVQVLDWIQILVLSTQCVALGVSLLEALSLHGEEHKDPTSQDYWTK